MRKTLRRIVAAVAAAMIAAPAQAQSRASADEYCTTYKQVASHATGGDWVGGTLVYETTGTVSRSGPTNTTTVTSSTTISAGLPVGASGSVSTTVTTTMAQDGSTFTTQEPIGIYAMNDGSMYEIDCVTGESRRIG